jgi:hypothetical protein
MRVFLASSHRSVFEQGAAVERRQGRGDHLLLALEVVGGRRRAWHGHYVAGHQRPRPQGLEPGDDDYQGRDRAGGAIGYMRVDPPGPGTSKESVDPGAP